MSRSSACLAATVFLLLLVIAYLMLVHKNGVYYIVLSGGADGRNGSCQVGGCVNLSTPTFNTGNNTRLKDKPRGDLCGEQNVTYVILFTYKRSGSTLTGEILNNHANNYYVFEPLHGFKDHYRNTVRDLHYNEKQSRKVVEALEGVLGCDFTKDLEAVSSPLTRSKSPRLKELGKCVKEKNKVFKECINIAQAECKTFSTRTVKIIRATMEEIQVLLTDNQDCVDRIKVIHLLRDPRGKANSHIHLPSEPYQFQKDSSGIKNLVDRFCARIMQDIHIRRKLEEKYPNTFLEKHYQEIADHLSGNMEDIYNFVWNIKPPKEAYSWIKIIEDGDSSKKDTYGIKRNNSSQTARKWKEQLKPDLIKHIEKSCKDLISYLNLDFIYH